ncbi:MAG TPA: PQQ-binding-like beta-propeller repeat protein [Actinomycetota bacterium]
MIVWAARTSATSPGLRVLAMAAVSIALVGLSGGVAGGTARGRTLWFAAYDGPANGLDAAEGIAASPDGSKVFVTGESWGGSTDFDSATIAYDAATGVRLWTARYNGPANGADSSQGEIAVSPDGSKVFVGAQSWGGSTGEDWATIAYDANSGSQLWATRFNGRANGDDYVYQIAVSPDGARVFATGSTPGRSGDDDTATAAYDVNTGAQVWFARYSGPDGLDDDAFAIGAAPDGSRVYVTGVSQSATTAFDILTIAYRASTGRRARVSRYDGPDSLDDFATDLGVAPDGSKVYVTGYSVGASTARDTETIAYDARTGAEAWESRYDGPDSLDDDGVRLAVSLDGSRVYVAGVSTSATTGDDWTTLSYDAATGDQLWLSGYHGDGAGADHAWAIGVSPDGSRVYVNGFTWLDATQYDYMTIAYDSASGAVAWKQRTGGGGSDFSYLLAVDPTGARVYVSGESDSGASGTLDFLTLAYTP